MIRTCSEGKSLVNRHWIVFCWILRNIEFDTGSYFLKDHKNQSAEEVFRTKKGVCVGYANSYKYLCDQLHMPCEVVGGYSKNYGFDNRENVSFETDHVWNVIEIDRHWYLVDVTWGAGFITEQKIFRRKLHSYYFCPRPNEMIYHHLPNDRKWQLLRKPIEMIQYLNLPRIYPTYFELHLELVSPHHQAYVDLVPDESYALVLIRASSDVHLIADMKLNNQTIDSGHRVMFDHKKQLYCCSFAPANIGKHKITVYGRRNNTESSVYNTAIDLTLDVKQMPKNPISFPKTWKTFSDLNLEIISPRDTHLIRILNGTAEAEILSRTPDNVALVGRLENNNGEKINGGNRVYYDKHKQLWRCKFAPDCNGMFEALIMGKTRADIGDYSPIVSFKIEAEQIPIPPLSYPKTWQLFYDLGMKVVAPRDRATIILPENENEVEIHIETPDNVELLGRLISRDQEKIENGDQMFYDRRKKVWRCRFAPNQIGTFDAEILAKKKSDNHNSSITILFKLQAKQFPTPHLSYPYTWQLFHDFDLKIVTPKDRASAVWSDNTFFTEIRIRAPDDVRLSCNIQYDDHEIKNGTLAQFDNNEQEWQLLFAPERTGPHKLAIYAERQSNTKILSSGAVAQFDLNVTKLENPIKFPLTYTKFQFNKCQIYEPLNGILKKDTLVPIHCVIPGAVEVDLKVDSKWINTEGYQDSILKTDVIVSSNDVIIYAKYGQKENYDGLIQYCVQ